MLERNSPALVLAPMDGITDAPMRALQGASGAFTHSVTEFIRVSQDPLPVKVFEREVPELLTGGRTPSGLPVQVQILGGDPERLAISAQRACAAGALGIDINFGCPAPTVNRHDGGASLLRDSCRIKEIVSAVRTAVPAEIPVSAKLRLGWDNIDAIFANAEMAQLAGASWITIHARTKIQGYEPPVNWPRVGEVRRNLDIPVVANGDIWSVEDFLRCQEETGCNHYMIGRGALADPRLPGAIALELGIRPADSRPDDPLNDSVDWVLLLNRLVACSEAYGYDRPHVILMRLKQWLNLASRFGDFAYFRQLKKIDNLDDFFFALAYLTRSHSLADSLELVGNSA